MKATILTIITALALAVSALANPEYIPAQSCTLIFKPNANLPPDCVELMWTEDNINATQCVDAVRDNGLGARPGCVRVAVYITTSEGVLKFLGWTWMSAEDANSIHQPDMASL